MLAMVAGMVCDKEQESASTACAQGLWGRHVRLARAPQVASMLVASVWGIPFRATIRAHAGGAGGGVGG